jgi:sterol desaturase/sphingolipid hydroxylase (fatty acid hydroxylase superfamily)
MPAIPVPADPLPPGWIPPLLGGALLALFTWLETRQPLRVARRPKARRVSRNLMTAALSALPSVALGFAVAPLLAWVAHERIGLLHVVQLPAWVHAVLAILLLDWTHWFWHWLNHEVPILWRFHLVHHVDQDLDASTALRFHYGELALAIPFRLLQVAVIGASATAFWVWSTALLASVLFHHSNLRLPARMEGLLVRVIVSPRMHGIHHSTIRSERNTNYASLLSIWDFLHRTCLLSVPQRVLRIGVPPLDEDERQVSFGRIMVLPFQERAKAGLADAAGPPRVVAARTTLVG